MNLSDLINVVKTSNNEQDRRFAVIDIGELNTIPAYEFLLDTCNDSDTLIAAVALSWAAKLNFDTRVYELLVENINSDDGFVRSIAAKSLGNPEIYRSDLARSKGIDILLCLVSDLIGQI